MKKNGFTLSEVLITLGIIGVVAALAAPSLVNMTQKSKVGPTLRKFVTTVENANEHLLANNDEDKISMVTRDNKEYTKKLKKIIKGDSKDNTFEFADGSTMSVGKVIGNADDLKNKNGGYRGKYAEITYDINGASKPNADGKDIFYFIIDDSGAVIPKGGKQYFSAYSAKDTTDWNTYCNEKTITDATYCSGAVADNNWKATYKY